MREWTARLAAALALGVVGAGCSDDDKDPTGPAPGVFTVTIQGLPELTADTYYEAWVRFPEPDGLAGGRRTLHDEGILVGLGAFRVAGGDTLVGLDGEPATFALAEPMNLNYAEEVLITVRHADADTTGSTILGGIVAGDDQHAHCPLTTGYVDALAADLRSAAGSCVLATPTDKPGGNESQGIWFTDAAGQPALQIPALSAAWTYAAWLRRGSDEPLLVGTFTSASGPDSDGKGPEAGVEPGFDAPGSDFVTGGGRNLADGQTKIVVTAEPHAEHGVLRHEEPFPLTVLELAIPLDAAPRTPMALVRPTTPLPQGEATFTR
jgi:hypothetical protein